jgi:8-oxo-dGTP pyrophosphatase MutT (NUDIX family)
MAFAKNNNKRKNKIFSCTNCGKNGHEYRDCETPTTSWGVILVNLSSDIKINHNNENGQTKIYSSLDDSPPYSSSMCINNTDQDRFLCSVIIDCISFLMISRKHSLGYVEFVRGRYKVEKPMQVTYLFKLMTSREIQKIKDSLDMDNGFDYLWEDMWGKKADHEPLKINRRDAKSKYNVLKHIGVDGPEIGLDFMVDKVSAEFDINEWGFPKGRRQRNETDKECAIREFMEESGYTHSDFEVIDDIEPIVEEFFGTNGIKYRHIYYVAELITNKVPRNDVTDSQFDEIGDIMFMNMNTAIQTIRPYHEEKISIIMALSQYYFDKVYSILKIDLEQPTSDQKVNK